jgi:hypothetical protein
MAASHDTGGDDRQPRPSPDDKDPLLTKHELAARIGGTCTPRTVIRCWRGWGLHPVKIGRELRFRDSDVTAWLKRRELGD